MAGSNQSGFLTQAEPPVELPFINGVERKRSEGVMRLMRPAHAHTAASIARQQVCRHVSQTGGLIGLSGSVVVSVASILWLYVKMGGAIVTSPTGFCDIPIRKPGGRFLQPAAPSLATLGRVSPTTACPSGRKQCDYET